ncbi:unnamed protein product [Dicrocoelium dendriticum]|nr:unnamed protein product [Dicrocoelium dendriticum]
MSKDDSPRLQHVQPGPLAYDAAYKGALEYLRGAIRQLSSCPNLCTTKTTAQELQRTAQYLSILTLEEELYNRASPKWRERFAERELVTQRQALLKVKDKLTDAGGQFLTRFRTNMTSGMYRCTTEECASTELRHIEHMPEGIGWTDTSIRAAYAWAEGELSALNQELEPLVSAAKKRLEQYTDEMDITDRYSGYRRNMGYMKKREPDDIKALETVLDTTVRPPVAPRWHLDTNWTRAEAVGTQNYSIPGDSNDCSTKLPTPKARYENTETVEKRPVAQLHYPGRSEYQDAYLIPTYAETGMASSMPPTTYRSTFHIQKGVRGRGTMVGIDPSQVQLKGYLVNPTPNFLAQFKKSNATDDECVISKVSEAADRFRWPKIPDRQEVSLPME